VKFTPLAVRPLALWPLALCPLALCLCSVSLFAQDQASLTVFVTDPSSAAVLGARVVAVDSHRGTIQQSDTNSAGVAYFNSLVPSDYTLEIDKDGFNKYRVDTIPLTVRARQEVHAQLQLAAAGVTRVDVVARIDALPSDPTQGTTQTHDFTEDLPLNGRDTDSLILLTPGMSSAQGGTDAGGFNANGLVATMNYYTLDGVSVNQPIAAGAGGGGFGGGPGGGGFGGGFGGGAGFAGGPGGGVPGVNGPGTMDAVTVDSMQEMRVQTSSIAPEFGRTPGAQIVMSSRGGTNSYHGTLYYYFRNERFDANNWFANAGGFGKGAEHENRPGGVFGGPIRKDKTLFFLSFEQLRLTAPYTVIADVPDVSTRASAPPDLQPFLNAYPIPNGAELTNGAAVYNSVVSSPLKSSNGSARIDQIITPHMTAFARFSFAPTSYQVRGSDFTSPSLLTNRGSHSDTATVGLTSSFLSGYLNDVRLNYSDFTSYSKTFMDTYGGAIPLTDSEVFPSGVTSATGIFNLNMIGLAGYSYGGQTRNNQAQINLVDSVSKTYRTHQIKMGLDVRQTRATNFPNLYSQSVSFNGLETTTTTPQYAFLTGQALNAQISSSVGETWPTYINYAMYGEDAWRVTKWTTITYGLRWDVNPAPYARYGQQPFAISSDPVAGVTQNSPLYPTKWWNVAPRIGVAYNMSDRRGHEMILRAGIGLFYDLGYGSTALAFNGAPFTDVRTLSEQPFPIPANFLVGPPIPPFRPYGLVNSADPTLVAPRVYQWNATWEHNYGVGTTLTVAIVGNAGRDLVRTETLPSYTGAYDLAILTTNGADSDYNGLQLQFRKRLSARFQMQASYTWSHSLDSTGGGGGANFASIFTGQRADSNYDIRQNFTAAGTYQIPAWKNGWLASPLRNWFIDFNFFARTGLPFDVEGLSNCASTSTTTTSITTGTVCPTSTSSGLFAMVRPSYTGLPIWVSNPDVPGGRELSPAAWALPTGFQQGTLGRNSLRGFGAEQLNLSVRKVIPIGEQVRLNIGVQAFNAFNHPNFANPSPATGANLASPNFGVVTQMLNSGLGGPASFFQSGGPRSMELSVRLQF
jgi:hypothetical protein